MSIEIKTLQFNRRKFLEETSGDLDTAFDCIDDLLGVLSSYAYADETNEDLAMGHLFGRKAHERVAQVVAEKGIAEFIENLDRITGDE